MEKPRILVINSCSKSKAISHPDQPVWDNLISNSDREFQKNKLKDFSLPAADLYTGQQAKSIKRAVELLKINHEVDYYIISAGFGFIKENELLPPYESSFSGLGKKDIKLRAKILEIEQKLNSYVRGYYNMIYLALGKDYLTAMGDLDFFSSKTDLLVYFVKELKNKQKIPFYLVEDSVIVNKLANSDKKPFSRPLGALITTKGTILENYALEISSNNLTIDNFPFNQWIEKKIEQINLLMQ